MMSSFTRLDRHNPPLFRRLPNSFRVSYDHHLLQRATHFLEIKGNRNRSGGRKTEKVYPFCTPSINKWYSFRMPIVLNFATGNASAVPRLERERLLYFLQS